MPQGGVTRSSSLLSLAVPDEVTEGLAGWSTLSPFVLNEKVNGGLPTHL